MSEDDDYRSFAPHQRPDVEVHVDEQWWPGELHAWSRRDGGWWGHVSWRTGPAQQYRRAVPADRIRLAGEDGPDYGQADHEQE